MIGSDFMPLKIVDVDLLTPLRDVALTNMEGRRCYGGVFCLVRLGRRPVGIAEFVVDGDVLTGGQLGDMIGDIAGAIDRGSTSTPSLCSRWSVSVVIATRDRAESLARCLDSLLKQTFRGLEIVVVDNAPSSSQTADLIAGRYSATSPVRYLREDIPGLGRAHNTGVANIRSDVVLFTDDDVIVDPEWAQSLAQNFDEGGKVGCVTGLILPAELETRAQFWTEKHGSFGKGFTRTVYDSEPDPPAGPLYPFTAGQFGSGANMGFRVDALRKIGGFDPALGAGTPAKGGDDLAAFYAIVSSGFRLVYEPEAIVWHHHRRDEDGMRRQALGYGMGLGAYLTKLAVGNPATAMRLLKAVPAGLSHMAGPASPKTGHLPTDYPTGLIWRERLGILAGIGGYIRSRAAVRRHAAAAVALTAGTPLAVSSK